MMKDVDGKINREPLKKRLLKFMAGLSAIVIFYIILAAGTTPPGICGEVLRHNRANKIDASPLFYSEVENIRELEAAVRAMREKADEDIVLNRSIVPD